MFFKIYGYNDYENHFDFFLFNLRFPNWQINTFSIDSIRYIEYRYLRHVIGSGDTMSIKNESSSRDLLFRPEVYCI